MKRLYLECYFGISLERMAGALLDLGADFPFIKNEVLKLPFHEIEIRVDEIRCGQLSSSHLEIKIKEEQPDNLIVIREIGFDRKVKKLVLAIIDVLAEAFGNLSKKSLSEVTLSDIGGAAVVAEITAVSAALVNLGIEAGYVSEVYEGSGHADSLYGLAPVPTPMVLEICRKYQIPLKITDIEGELVTPAGAAVLAALCRADGERPNVILAEKVGIGIEKGASKNAGILRLMLLQEDKQEQEPTEKVWVLESNIDDATGEQLGYTIELLMRAGARDASCLPVLMKKNRPAFLLQVICDAEHREDLEQIIFRETTSIGLRRFEEERNVLKRHFEDVETPYGSVRYKVCSHHGEAYYYPEFEDVAEIARRTGKSFAHILRHVRKL